MTSTCDVLVAGGGPAGCALALTLARYTSRRVVVVELRGYGGVRVGETLQPGAENVFRYLGVWEAFLAARHQPSHSIRSSWGSPVLHERSYFMTPHGGGWHLDRARFDAMLAAEAERAGVMLLSPARLTSLERAPGGWLAKVARRGGETLELQASFVVDATGRKAPVAVSLGASHRIDDDLVGVYCFGRDDAATPDGDGSTLIEAAADGWWYSTYLPDRRVVAAFLTDGDLVREKRLLSLQRWIELLAKTRHTRDRLLGCSALPRLRAWRAHSRILAPVAGDRWVAVGDAAVSHDPLSSMGIAHALSSGMHAGRAIDAALNGDPDLLRQYIDGVHANYRSYREMQRRFYCAEQRWPEAPFWKRRHTGMSAAGDERFEVPAREA